MSHNLLKIIFRKYSVTLDGLYNYTFIELFFCKKIPLSRRVEYLMDGSMDHSVSERCMYVTPIRSDLL